MRASLGANRLEHQLAFLGEEWNRRWSGSDRLVREHADEAPEPDERTGVVEHLDADRIQPPVAMDPRLDSGLVEVDQALVVEPRPNQRRDVAAARVLDEARPLLIAEHTQTARRIGLDFPAVVCSPCPVMPVANEDVVVFRKPAQEAHQAVVGIQPELSRRDLEQSRVPLQLSEHPHVVAHDALRALHDAAYLALDLVAARLRLHERNLGVDIRLALAGNGILSHARDAPVFLSVDGKQGMQQQEHPELEPVRGETQGVDQEDLVRDQQLDHGSALALATGVRNTNPDLSGKQAFGHEGRIAGDLTDKPGTSSAQLPWIDDRLQQVTQEGFERLLALDGLHRFLGS